MKGFLIAVLATAALAACDEPTDDETMRVRVENVSSLTYEEVLIGFEDDTLELGTVAAGATTGYARIDAPQELALVSLRTDGVTHTMGPAPGSLTFDDDDFTLAIDLDTGGGGIGLEVTED